MFKVVEFSFNAIAPILIMIIIGFVARRIGLLNIDTVKVMNKFNFKLCLGCLLFTNVYTLNADFQMPWNLVGFVLFAFVIILIIGFLSARLITDRKGRRGVLIMDSYRSNYAIIGVVLAEALAGPAGGQLTSVFQLPTVLFFNIVSVIVLSSCSENGAKVNVKNVILGVCKNPLIIGLLLGFACLLVRGIIPAGADGNPVFTIKNNLPWLYTSISYLSRTCTPLALIILGAQLEIKEIGEYKKEIIHGVSFRLVIAPLIGFGLAFLASSLGIIELNPAVISMLIAAFASPAAVASVAMSAEMGNDDALAGQIVVWTSIFSMGTIFIICSIFRALGLL